MTERKYLPTLAELIDRLSIVILKSVFIPENREAYLKERYDIEDDIRGLLAPVPELAMGRVPVGVEEITAAMIIMLANRTIWLSEHEARKGLPDNDKLLKFSHSINGVRNAAKNVISKIQGDRIDLKVDSFAAGLPPELGSWNLFEERK